VGVHISMLGKQLYLQSFTARLSFFTIRGYGQPKGTQNSGCPSAGINRHEAENERVLQERSSEPS